MTTETLEVIMLILGMAALYAIPLKLEFTIPYHHLTALIFAGIAAIFVTLLALSTLRKSIPG